MVAKEIGAIVLAAGKGTRMHSDLPKVMHKLAGRPMINHLLSTLDSAGVSKIVVVVSPDMGIVQEAVSPHSTAIQSIAKGTGDAVKCTASHFKDFQGDILILFGDTPLLSAEIINKMIAKRAEGSDIVVLAFDVEEHNRYGRIVISDGSVERIVEYKDATEEERMISLCNSGLMCVNGKKLFSWLDKLDNNNVAKEYYLTDIVSIAKSEGAKTSIVKGDAKELLGINTLSELATAEKIVQNKLRAKFMDNGVTLTDPDTVYFSFDTKIGRGVTIEPFVFFDVGVEVGDNVTVKAFSHFERAFIGNSVNIGPFSRLRPDARIMEEAHIGNFVEVKKSVIEKGAKVNHLTYIGDAKVGSKANIGAGTITCNYDGFCKSKTEIGEGAFIGSNTSLVAPVSVGKGAIIGAGSVITKDVSEEALAITRAPQVEKKDWAKKFREVKSKGKK